MTEAQQANWPTLRQQLIEELSWSDGRRLDGSDKYRPSQRGLAEYAGVDGKTVSRWVHGTRLPLRVHYLTIATWVKTRQKRRSKGR